MTLAEWKSLSVTVIHRQMVLYRNLRMIYEETRNGIYFNKRILTEAGIDPEELYDLQASGDWTWDKFEEYLSIVQRDLDSDGVIDIAGFNENNGVVQMSVFSNDGAFIGKDASGMFTYALEDPNTFAIWKMTSVS